MRGISHDQIPDKDVTVIGTDRYGLPFTETFQVKAANPKRIAKAIAKGWQARRGYPITMCRTVHVTPTKDEKTVAK